MSIPVSRKVKYKNGEIGVFHCSNRSYGAKVRTLVEDLQEWCDCFYMLLPFRQTKETVLQYYPRILDIVQIENDIGEFQDIDFRNYLLCLNDDIDLPS